MKYYVFLYWFIVSVSLSSNARNYYFSQNGSDLSSGRHPKQALQSISRINKLKLLPGDTLFFERGSTFHGSIRIQRSGLPGKPIVLSAYGNGPAPVFSGAEPVFGWESIGNQRFSAPVNKMVFELFSNQQRLVPARYPNNGFLTIDWGYGKDSITCNQLQHPDGYWDGATMRIRTIDWAYETRTIRNYKKGLLIQGAHDRYLVEASFVDRTQNGKQPLYHFQKGYGFYLEGLPEMIDTSFEWSWKNGALVLQLPENQTPESANILATTHLYGIWLAHGVKYIVIEGLLFEHYEKAGVGGGWSLSDITIADNEFRQIHGSGILLDSASNNCRILSNRFSDILGRGISALEAVSIEVFNNELKRIGLVRGHGWTGVNGASGIILHNVERKVQTDTTFAHLNVVRYNRVDSCGYIGIRVDGYNNLVEYNVIDYCSLTLNDGANLYCFGAGPGVTHHSVFRNNIVRYSIGDSKATPGNPNMAFGIYLDNFSSGMIIEGNTVITTGAAGIINNDASHSNTIRNNIIFDCKEGIGFAEWARPGGVHDMVVEQNLVVGIQPYQKLVSMVNFIGPRMNAGHFAENRYIHLLSTSCFHYGTKQSPEFTRLDLSLEQWQRLIQSDEGSSHVTATTEWANGLHPEIFVNEYMEEKVLDAGSDSLFLHDGKPSGRMIRIRPFSSLVILRKN